MQEVENPTIPPEVPQIDHAKLSPCLLHKDIDLSHFDCGDDDLNSFIKDDALNYQEQNLSQTTCVIYEGKMIGYFTLACDALSLEKKIKQSIFSGSKQIRSYPALKIARMAFDKKYQRKRIGTVFLEAIKGHAWLLNKQGVGCRFITVDAYSDKVAFYIKNGFEYNIKKDSSKSLEESERKTISLRLNILK